MSFLDSSWPLICLVTYGVIVAALLIGNHRWVRLQHADDTQRASYPPPVPPSRLAADDAEWLAPWPTDTHAFDVTEVRALLSDDIPQEQYDRKCREIFAIEGLSS